MDRQFYIEYYDLERNHWWFKARLKILETTFKKHIGDKKRLKILNVGVATGATTEMLQKFGDVTSLEYDKECCAFLKEKTGIDAVNASLTELSFSSDTFDVVCAYDVIEHIEADILAITEIHRVLNSNGQYMITVPAYQFLWSNHDVVNHHFRRYTKTELVSKLSSATFTTEYTTYFNTLLFPPIAFVRFLLNLLPKGKNNKTSGSDNEVLSSNGLLNKMLFQIFKSEEKILSKKVSLPFGVSILSIGRKR